MSQWISPDKGLEVYMPNNFSASKINKLACFDLDGTLIITKNRSGRPKDRDDWQWFEPTVIEMVRNLYQQGYQIVICTNQSQYCQHIKEKIEIICELLDTNTLVLISTLYTKYRKPMIGFWDYLMNILPNVNKDDCFYVGDSAFKGLDYSDCDILWAYNVGIRFYYSYNYFRSNDENYTSRILPVPRLPDIEYQGNNNRLILNDLDRYDIILLMGPPLIGKTTVANKIVQELHFSKISMDDFDTVAEYKRALLDLIQKNSRLIIDDRHTTVEERRQILNIVDKENTNNLRIVLLKIHPKDNQREIAEYLNYHNCYTSSIQDCKSDIHINQSKINDYYRRLEEPTEIENFDMKEYYCQFQGLDKYY